MFHCQPDPHKSNNRFSTCLRCGVIFSAAVCLMGTPFSALAQTVSIESPTSAPAGQPVFNLEKTLFDGSAPHSIAELKAMEKRVAEVVEDVEPAIVNIQMAGSQGSGVVVSSDGYILTAAHVIGNPGGKAQIVFADGKKVNATTLGIEHGIDSGMLKIDADQGTNFPYINLGLSDELKPGQWVLAIGHPGGLDEDRGLVVRVGRLLSASSRVLRTDATLVGGDSGGALVDMNGDLIGIHSRIGNQLWNNLHVPVDTYSEKWDRLANSIIIDGRPNLGFSVVEATNKVESVVEGGPAEKAGIKKGDVVIKVHGESTEDRDDISEAVNELRPNMEIKVVFQRDGKEQTVEMVVGQR